MASGPGILQDQFGRVHDYLRISLVDKCNLRCTYCMPENIRFLPSASLMQADEILGMARYFKEQFGVKKIRLTGGEPLLRKDFAAILHGLASLDVELALTTNGILLDTFFDDLDRAGLRSINVSLDTLQKERFLALTRRDEFDKVMGNIQLALDRGFRIKLNAVALRNQNEDEFLDFVELTRERDLHVRFIEFMPFDGNAWDLEKVVPYAEILDRIGKAYPISKLEDKANSTSKAWQLEGAKGTFAVISTVTAPFCSGCNRLRLTAEGKLRNCLFAREEVDLLSAWRRGEDIGPLVVASLQAKAARLGGLPELGELDLSDTHLSDRAMVKIGG